MAYGILKTLLYYFLIGTEVYFAVTSAGDSEYLDGGVMNFLKMTERSQTLSVAWFHSRCFWTQFFDLKLNIDIC